MHRPSQSRPSPHSQSVALAILAMLATTALLALMMPGAAAQQQPAEAEDPPPPVSFESLLQEMTDRSSLARWPDPEYRLLQASSFDRRSREMENPSPAQSDEGWFANEDYGKYLRVEHARGRSEKVLMDARGPGAIVRIWSANPDIGGTLRIYIDEADEPVIAESFRGLTDGNGRIAPPLSAVRARGHNLYLPIPFAKRCKVTLDGDENNRLYYVINYRKYESGARVRSFAAADLEAQRALLEQMQPLLEWPIAEVPGAMARATADMAMPLAAGDSLEVEIKEGPGALYELRVEVSLPEAGAAGLVLRSLVLEGWADGKRRIHVPLGDFFASGAGVSAFCDFYRKVEIQDDQVALTGRWIMPFSESMSFRLTNRGEGDVDITLSTVAGQWQWDDRSMYFHADFVQQRDIPTRPRRDFNYLQVEGQGVFVGDTLAVANPSLAWWGEGDEKIYIDGQAFPSHLGTGTEDYYGYAWCSPETFAAPFHAQVRADGPGNFGHVTNTRVRALDAICFDHDFRFDMELWHWEDVKISYAATTCWYGRPGAIALRPAADDELDLAVPELPPPPRK